MRVYLLVIRRADPVVGADGRDPGLRAQSPAGFGYIATGYLLVAGVVQFTIPRFLKPEFSLVLGLIAQVFSMVMMTMALESGSVASAAVSLVLSGFSYGAVFVGGAILVNSSR